MERLLSNAVDGVLGRDRCLGLITQAEVDVHTLARTNRRRLMSNGHHQAIGLQRLRAQIEDERPHLGQPAVREVEHVIQRLQHLVAVSVQQLQRRVHP